MRELITSLQNPKIKNIVRLSKASQRKEQGLFVIEGLQEYQHARNNGIEISSLFYCPDIVKEDETIELEKNDIPVHAVSREVYSKIAYRESTEGVIALARVKNIELDDLVLSNNPLFLVLESVEKPGNLGSIMRIADASGVDAVIVCDPSTDVFNPNVIRSSVGCLFTVPIVVTDSASAIHWLKKKEIFVVAAALQTEILYDEPNFEKPCAIVLGTESTGLTSEWISSADKIVKIPMNGKNDSLNVSVSAAVIVYEALRQRKHTL